MIPPIIPPIHCIDPMIREFSMYSVTGMIGSVCSGSPMIPVLPRSYDTSYDPPVLLGSLLIVATPYQREYSSTH